MSHLWTRQWESYFKVKALDHQLFQPEIYINTFGVLWVMGWRICLSWTSGLVDDTSCEAGKGVGDGPDPALPLGSKPKTTEPYPAVSSRSSPGWGSGTYCSTPAFGQSSSKQGSLTLPSSPPGTFPPSPVVQNPSISRAPWLQLAPLFMHMHLGLMSSHTGYREDVVPSAMDFSDAWR